MEHTAPAILEIGAVLLVAAGAGWLARFAGVPAVVGYLAVGLLISPFTPGYVAHREQIQLLADFGVVLLLFEVGIEVDLLRLPPRARTRPRRADGCCRSATCSRCCSSSRSGR
jgi:Kef-type K+ transport system membrane component KefB